MTSVLCPPVRAVRINRLDCRPDTRAHCWSSGVAADGAVCVVLLLATWGCAPDYRPCVLNGNCGDTVVAGSVFPVGQGFTEELIQGRTFLQGVVVTTETHAVDDLGRSPLLVDFNADGRADPVIGYQQQEMGVVQILLSYGDPGTVNFQSLTLDGGENQWQTLEDIAVGDIDGDGNLDLVIATLDGVVYLHHPSNPRRTHVLSEWGQATGALEIIEGTSSRLTREELEAIVQQVLGPTADLSNYIVQVEEGYSSVEIADFDNDGDNDIAAARHQNIKLQPAPDKDVEAWEIVAGSIQVLLNPGGARDGLGWIGVPVGLHERHQTLDREGARDLRVIDIDQDGDLDIISSAVDDRNVQVAWFENPAGPGQVNPADAWLQRRIGSVRGAATLDVADVTGDGRQDVLAVSTVQKQLLLFVQPESVSDRGYDWYSVPIVSFASYEPLSVKAVDVDNDGVLEAVVGGTAGAVRYFERADPYFEQWTGHEVATLQPPGDTGLIGYGDLDGDGDADLVTAVSGQDAETDRVIWIRNQLVP